MIRNNSSKSSVMKLVFLIIAIIIIILGISLYIPHKSQEIPQDISIVENDIENKNEYYIRLADNYFDDDDLSKLYNMDTAEYLLKNFNENLNKQFDFYEITFQPFQSLNRLEIDNKFYKKYGRKNDTIKNQEIMIEGEKCYVSSLNTIQVNQKAYDRFINSISNGRGFRQEDFLFDEQKLPIILGHDYMEYYSIGDIWELNYLEVDMNMEIIGFFDENAGFFIDDNEYILNAYICSPSFQIEKPPANDAERTFQLRYYLQKNQGFIKCEDGYDKNIVSEKQVNNIKSQAAKYGLDYTTLTYLNKISKIGLN